MFDLVGKAAIVTGGGSGIGAAIAQRFRTAGAHVLIADISPEAEARAAEWGCAFLRTNVDEPAGVEALCKEAVNRFGKLDIMINNAGIASGHLLADADAARSERFWRVHILGVQMGIKEAAARMTAGGTIVNISSIKNGKASGRARVWHLG